MAPEFLAFVAKRSHCEPEYIVNEVLANVLRRLPDLDIPSENEFRAYVYRSLRNRLADEGRRAAVVTVPIDTLPEGAGPTVEFEGDVVRRMSMGTLLDRLTPAQRAVISSRFLHGLSLEETAVRVGKPVRSVKALQSRGLRTLRVAAGVLGVVAVLILGLLVFRSRVDTDLQPVDTNGGQIEPDRDDGTDGVTDGTQRSDHDAETQTDGTIDPEMVDNGGGVVPPPVGGAVRSASGIGADAVRVGEIPATAGPASPASADGTGTGPGATTVAGAGPAYPVASTVPGAPTTAPTVAPATVPAPATTTTVGAVTAPRCLSVEGPTTVVEGTTTSYHLLFDKTASSDRTLRLDVITGLATWVASPSGVDNQDIMWGGYYTTWLTAPLLPPVQTGTVYGRVLVPASALLGLLPTDHPMVGPADATWDFSLLSRGVVLSSPWVDVRVPAGALRSDPFEVRAHKEKVTIDLRGNHAGFEEAGESFGLGASGCNTTVTITNASTQVFVNNNV